MQTETTTMQTTVIYNDDKTHRYLLRKEWDSDKPSAEIIMLYPSSADTVTVDHTTMFVLQNLERLDYGSVNIVNLFSSMSDKHSTLDIDEDNMNYIMECAEKSDIIIFATGTGGDGNKTVLRMQKQVLDMLKPFHRGMVGKKQNPAKFAEYLTTRVCAGIFFGSVHLYNFATGIYEVVPEETIKSFQKAILDEYPCSIWSVAYENSYYTALPNWSRRRLNLIQLEQQRKSMKARKTVSFTAACFVGFLFSLLMNN